MSEWQEVTLDEIAEINPKEKLSKGCLAHKISMENLFPFCKKVSGKSLEPFNGGTKFRNGDTLIARITPCLENGKTAYVDVLNDGEIGFGSTEYIVLREKPKKSYSQYLYYFARSDFFRGIAIASMTGSSGRQRVQTDVVRNYLFEFPDYEEQQAIASILSSLDDKIDLLHRQNKTLESIAETLFRQWFIESPQKYWTEKPLSKIATFTNGLACQNFPVNAGELGLPVLKIKELNTGITDSSDIASSNVKPEYIVHHGDIIFSWSASLMVKIWSGPNCVLNQHLFNVKSDKYPKWFYYEWCKYHLKEFISISQSHATTMGHIKRKDLDEAKVIIPSDEEMKKMNTEMDLILSQHIEKLKQIQTLEKLRDTLLPKLMSGEVRVKYSN